MIDDARLAKKKKKREKLAAAVDFAVVESGLHADIIRKHFGVKKDVNPLRVRRRVFSFVGEESMTDESQAEGTDINKLVVKYMKDGHIPLPDKEAVFADVFKLGSFHEAQDMVVRGKELFASLPVATRDRFDNDPGKFLEFVDASKDPKEVGELFGYKTPLDKAEGRPNSPEAKGESPPSPKPKPAAPKQVAIKDPEKPEAS